jgi:signal transduction histidine kinase
MIEVEDDGMGFLLERLEQPMASGIGLANVRERPSCPFTARHIN